MMFMGEWVQSISIFKSLIIVIITNLLVSHFITRHNIRPHIIHTSTHPPIQKPRVRFFVSSLFSHRRAPCSYSSYFEWVDSLKRNMNELANILLVPSYTCSRCLYTSIHIKYMSYIAKKLHTFTLFISNRTFGPSKFFHCPSIIPSLHISCITSFVPLSMLRSKILSVCTFNAASIHRGHIFAYTQLQLGLCIQVLLPSTRQQQKKEKHDDVPYGHSVNGKSFFFVRSPARRWSAQRNKTHNELRFGWIRESSTAYRCT